MGLAYGESGTRLACRLRCSEGSSWRNRIRDRFFAGSPTLQVNFSVTPIKLDATVSRFILEIDGQRITYQHEAERTQPIRWPGPCLVTPL